VKWCRPLGGPNDLPATRVANAQREWFSEP